MLKGCINFSTKNNSNTIHKKTSLNTNHPFCFSGTCCTYQSQLTAIDARGNMKTKTIDFLGGNVFNTTVENFDILTKPIPVKVKKTDHV